MHLRAKAAPRADVVRAIGKAFNLTVVEHAELDGLVTAEIDGRFSPRGREPGVAR